jgi:hypothetical protein
MNTALCELTEHYSAGLREYCAKGACAPPFAFQPSLLGHRAASEGLGVPEMVAMHQNALVEVLLEMAAGDEITLIARRASEFLAEALAPFEERHRRCQEEHSMLCEVRQVLEQWLRASQRNLVAARDQLLEQRMAELRKNESICVMTHEMHGSLSVLMSGQGGKLNAHGQRLLDLALRNSERVMLLVGDSPEVQTIESGAMTFNGTRNAH